MWKVSYCSSVVSRRAESVRTRHRTAQMQKATFWEVYPGGGLAWAWGLIRPLHSQRLRWQG